MSKNIKKIIIVIIVVAGLFLGYKIYESNHYGFLNYNLQDIYSDLEKNGYMSHNYTSDQKVEFDQNEFIDLKSITFTEVKDITGNRLYGLQGGNSYLTIIEKDGTYYLGTNSYRAKNDGKSVYTLIEDGYEHIYTSKDLKKWVEDAFE